MVDRARRPRRPRRPGPLRRPPRARQRARPDLARPVRRGGPHRDRRRRPGRLHRRAARARRARATPTSARSSASTRPGSRPWRRLADARPRARSPAAGSSWSRTSSAPLPREEKPWIRDLAGQLVVFCRAADRAPDVLFAWSLAVTDATPDREASFAANRSLWDAWTAVHAAGDFYDLEGFKAGGVRLRPYEIEMIGDVAGRSLLHLQCHFGIDTLSWARLGARVTGADLSPAAIELARSLADELGFPDARFVQLEPVRPAGGARRRLRHRLHVARRARLAARHPRLGAGRRPLPGAGRDVLHHRERTRSSSVFEDEGVGAGRAAPAPTRTGSTRSRWSSRSRARTPTRTPTSATRPSTAGITGSARS